MDGVGVAAGGVADEASREIDIFAAERSESGERFKMLSACSGRGFMKCAEPSIKTTRTVYTSDFAIRHDEDYHIHRRQVRLPFTYGYHKKSRGLG